MKANIKLPKKNAVSKLICIAILIETHWFKNYNYAQRKILDIILSEFLKKKIKIIATDDNIKIPEKFAKRYKMPIEIIKSSFVGENDIKNLQAIKKSDLVIVFGNKKKCIEDAKINHKKIFVFNTDPETINDEIGLDINLEHHFEFGKNNEILMLQYNKDFSNSNYSYPSYLINRFIEKKDRYNVLNSLRKHLIKTNNYDKFINQAKEGLYFNPSIDLSEVNLILFPETITQMGLDIASIILNKMPNCLFLKLDFNNQIVLDKMVGKNVLLVDEFETDEDIIRDLHEFKINGLIQYSLIGCFEDSHLRFSKHEDDYKDYQ